MLNIREEYVKCFQDKSRIYFIENYLSTFNAMERKDVPFITFPRQKVYLRSAAKYNNLIAIKHRQCGITTLSAAWSCGQCVFMTKGAPETILCIANKLDQAVELANKIVNFLDQVPRWMWGKDFYSPDPDDEKNRKSIYIKRNKNYIELWNGCKIYARASGPHAARGISAVTILIMDEAAFLAEGPASFASAVAAQATVANPKCFIVSTPNGKDQLYYSIYSKALKGENNFHVVEFKWYQDLRYNRNLKWFKKNKETGELLWDIDFVIDKKGNVKYDEERWKKLEQDGWTPTSPWFETMCQTFNNDSQKIAQELLVSFLGSSDNVVQPEIIERQSKQNVIKIDENWLLKDVLTNETWIWKDPNPTHRYICSVDVSTGSSDDFSAIEIIDVDAVDEKGVPCFEQVLEYNGKLTGEEIGFLVDRYARAYNEALVVVECIGGYGEAVILKLMQLAYPNLYYDENDTLKNYTADYAKKLYKKKDEDKLPGFRSNALRLQMISNFVEMIKNNSFRIRSARVINELETWVFKNGRPDHMEGMHDDLLTCLAMGLFVMQFYMLKVDKMKQKDKSIVVSWRVNNANNTNFNTRHLQDEVEISKPLPKKINPFAVPESRNFNKFIGACVMLGGFKAKKEKS